MKKQPEITAQTRQNIVDAFWKLYCQKRIDKITVREVMDIAGYNRGTFYEYFTDIYAVLEQLENELMPNPANIPSASQNPNSTLQTFGFNEFFKFYEKNNEYFTVLLGEHGDPSFLPKIKKAVKPIIKQGLIAKGAKDTFELDVLIEYNLSAMLGVLNLWFTSEDRPSMEEFVECVYKAGRWEKPSAR